MSFLSAIYKLTKGSGFPKLLVAACLIVYGSVEQILMRKHYNKRSLKFIYEVLKKLLIKKGRHQLV